MGEHARRAAAAVGGRLSPGSPAQPAPGQNPAAFPLERAKIFYYNPEGSQWSEGAVQVQMAAEPFGKGGMRAAHHALVYTRRATTTSVLKVPHSYQHASFAFLDVQMQMVSKCLAEKFCERLAAAYPSPDAVPGDLKTLEFVPAFVIQMLGRSCQPCYAAEVLITGAPFKKYNDNNGWVNPRESELPQAFSHFTFEETGRSFIIVDLQGMGIFFTDPQIHSVDQRGWGTGNLGTFGIQRFFSSHVCGPVCQAVGLPNPAAAAPAPAPAPAPVGVLPGPPVAVPGVARPAAVPIAPVMQAGPGLLAASGAAAAAPGSPQQQSHMTPPSEGSPTLPPKVPPKLPPKLPPKVPPMVTSMPPRKPLPQPPQEPQPAPAPSEAQVPSEARELPTYAQHLSQIAPVPALRTAGAPAATGAYGAPAVAGAYCALPFVGAPPASQYGAPPASQYGAPPASQYGTVPTMGSPYGVGASAPVAAVPTTPLPTAPLPGRLQSRLSQVSIQQGGLQRNPSGLVPAVRLTVDPQSLSADFDIRFDGNTRRWFFVNHSERSTSFTPPPGAALLPPGWEARFEHSKRRWFYVDHNSQRTTYDSPVQPQPDSTRLQTDNFFDTLRRTHQLHSIADI